MIENSIFPVNEQYSIDLFTNEIILNEEINTNLIDRILCQNLVTMNNINYGIFVYQHDLENINNKINFENEHTKIRKKIISIWKAKLEKLQYPDELTMSEYIPYGHTPIFNNNKEITQWLIFYLAPKLNQRDNGNILINYIPEHIFPNILKLMLFASFLREAQKNNNVIYPESFQGDMRLNFHNIDTVNNQYFTPSIFVKNRKILIEIKEKRIYEDKKGKIKKGTLSPKNRSPGFSTQIKKGLHEISKTRWFSLTQTTMIMIEALDYSNIKYKCIPFKPEYIFNNVLHIPSYIKEISIIEYSGYLNTMNTFQRNIYDAYLDKLINTSLNLGVSITQRIVLNSIQDYLTLNENGVYLFIDPIKILSITEDENVEFEKKVYSIEQNKYKPKYNETIDILSFNNTIKELILEKSFKDIEDFIQEVRNYDFYSQIKLFRLYLINKNQDIPITQNIMLSTTILNEESIKNIMIKILSEIQVKHICFKNNLNNVFEHFGDKFYDIKIINLITKKINKTNKNTYGVGTHIIKINNEYHITEQLISKDNEIFGYDTKILFNNKIYNDTCIIIDNRFIILTKNNKYNAFSLIPMSLIYTNSNPVFCINKHGVFPYTDKEIKTKSFGNGVILNKKESIDGFALSFGYNYPSASKLIDKKYSKYLSSLDSKSASGSCCIINFIPDKEKDVMKFYFSNVGLIKRNSSDHMHRPEEIALFEYIPEDFDKIHLKISEYPDIIEFYLKTLVFDGFIKNGIAKKTFLQKLNSIVLYN